ALAVLLTLPLPVTVSMMGPLDWGPVIGGYVATLFLAAAYISIGLTMSGRTDNPVVALILTVVVCAIFYLIGSNTLINLAGFELGNILAALGTGSRFESITRGVLDIRDLYFYISLVGVFLTWNIYSLERLRWAGNPDSQRHQQWRALAGLAVANFIVANVWLAHVGWARVDMTDEKRYSLSDATVQQLASLQEPLLIRGYFSNRTHPLLAPLIPQLQDLLQEYAEIGGERVRVEFIDPTRDPEAEEQAASRYGIRPVPFQTSDRYQASVVSSYFDLVVAYGDEYETLNYQKLIEVRAGSETDLDVVLKNPEYVITSTIRNVASSFRAGGNAIDAINGDVRFTAYMSPAERLPDALQTLRSDLEDLLGDYRARAGDRLQVDFVDPDAGDGSVALDIQRRFGFGPQITSLFDPQPFWFYMVVENAGQTIQVPMPDMFDRDSLSRSLDAAFKRLAPGILKTVALARPENNHMSRATYQLLEMALEETVRLKHVDLSTGVVPADADMLIVLAPEALGERELFAIDQFLMQGGSVLLATSEYNVDFDSGLVANRHYSGLRNWLSHHGINIEETLVVDPRSAALPIPVARNIGGIQILDYQMLPYALFPDLRDDSLNADSAITSSLGQLSVNWVSPISLDSEKTANLSVTELLRSSKDSWTMRGLSMLPDYQSYPNAGFMRDGDVGARTLAVALEGQFSSYFAGKDSPLAPTSAPAAEDENSESSVSSNNTVVTGVIDRSPESARLFVVASNSFANDISLQLASQGLGTEYTKPQAFVQNVIDWSLEDRDLLALRGRTELARILAPMDDAERRTWESANYALAFAGLMLVWLWRRGAALRDRRRYQLILQEVKA
ncbi:MAG TPA: Gldg family protein, partial [Pseudohongiella sp.]|nr:Gldg family protein [Pseudohongiella sp.]